MMRKNSRISKMLVWLVAVVLCIGLVKMDTYAASSTLKIAGQSEPSKVTQGKSFDCKGVITSNYKLTNVTGKITTSSGTVKYQKSVNPSSKKAVYRYSLLGSTIDCNLLFNKLGTGSYKYVITAKDSSGKSKTLVNKSFSVVGNSSTLKISGNSALTSLKLGKSWTCNGTISSNYKITQVYGAILKSDGVTQVYKKTVKPNAKSYKLAGSAIDKAMLFNKLPVGTYYYVVDATDASGKKLNVVKNKFTVQGDTSTLKISGNSALTSLKPGKSWTCNGTISSNYKITQVYGAILKSDGVTKVYSKTVKPNAKSYKLAGGAIDCALLFNKLSVGTYYYVVDATDASGKKLNVVKNKFTVQKDASTLKISGNAAITSLIKGKSWTCNGTISSNYKITQVYGAILKSDGVTQAYKKTVKPNAKSFKLAGSAIDKALLFNKLSEGTYYYVVDATDASGKKLNVVKNKFTVTKVGSEKIILDTKDYKNLPKVGNQTDNWSCVARALAHCRTILDNKVHYYTEYVKDGYAYPSMANYYYITAKNEDEFYNEIYKQINAGKPCIIRAYENPKYTKNPGAHSVTVVGYTNVTNSKDMTLKNLIIYDSWKRQGKQLLKGDEVFYSISSLVNYKIGCAKK